MALHANPSVVALFGAAMLAAGSIAILASARHVWRASAVVRASDLDALDGSGGALVRVAGTVRRRDDTLLAPFSRAESVAVRYRVEERRLGFPIPLPWDATVASGTRAVPFTVETDAGIVPVVEPVRTVTLTPRVVATAGPAGSVPDHVAAFDREHVDDSGASVWRDHPSVFGPLFQALSLGTRRYSEQRAAVGDRVTVVGRVTADGTGVDPIVVSDRSAAGTLGRMARTSLAGLAVGLAGLVLGALLLLGA